jgi:hypothetical protein
MQFSRYAFVGLLAFLPTLSAAQAPPTPPPPHSPAMGTIASPAPQPPAETPTLSPAQAPSPPAPQPPTTQAIASPTPPPHAVTPIASARLCSDAENAPGRTLDDLKQIIASCRTVIRNQAGTISDQRNAISVLAATTTSLTKTTNAVLEAMRKRPTQSCNPSGK